MACTQVTVEGVEAYTQQVAANQGKTIFALFTGKPDAATGKSWCPDCVTADPVLESCLDKIPPEAVFIKCYVGDRPTWKDPNNAFRKHPGLLLKSVPTLLKVGSPQRLSEAECANADLVSMLFEDD